MSGMKPPELSQFFARLKERNRDAGTLADLLGLSRPAVTRVLNGLRRWGPIGRKLEPLLTAEEMRLLDVAHRSPWNTRRVAKRPRWMHRKDAVLAHSDTLSNP